MKQQKTILVTGSTYGIGAAIALRFGRGGYKVILNSRNDESKKEIMDTLSADGVDTIYYSADVSHKDQVTDLFAKIKQKFGSLDVLVNNAGKSGEDEFACTTEKDLEKIFNVNFSSAYYCCQEGVKLIETGSIINISSICGASTKCEDLPVYSGAKAAMRNLSKNLAKLYAPKIRVNTILPGFVKTPSWGEMTEKEEADWGNKQLIKRFIRPDEIADAAWFLAHNEAITGAELVVDGGQTIT